MKVLESIEEWLRAPDEDVSRALDALAHALGPQWRPVATESIEVHRQHWSQWAAVDLEQHHAALATPSQGAGPGILHVESGVVFRVVPGGLLRMGMSQEEDDALFSDAAQEADESGELEYLMAQRQRARPVRTVRMRPYLVSATPLTGRQLRALGWQNDGRASRLFVGDDCITSLDPSEVPALLGRDDLRLPSEAEWEHACRAGSTTPFFWGVEVPKRPNERLNPLGLAELGNHQELCADRAHGTYDGAPDDQRPWTVNPQYPEMDVRMVRGGAADLYPWQGCGEWQKLLSFARYAIDANGDEIDRQICLRLVRSLPE